MSGLVPFALPRPFRVSALALIALWPCAALAQASAPAPSPEADALFLAAVHQMQDAHCLDKHPTDSAACLAARSQFSRVYASAPTALGALRNQAFIEKSLGLLASAESSFRELTRVAPSHIDPSRRQWAVFAQAELSDLAPRVPVLTIELRGVSAGKPSLTLDGAVVAPGSLRVDPGTHLVVLQVAGLAERRIRIALAERDHTRVVIDLAGQGASDSVANTSGSKPAPAPTRSSVQTWGTALGVTGGALVAVGLGFGVAAWQSKRTACGGSALCEPSGYASAARSARAANWLVGGGAILAAGGVGMALFASPGPRGSATLLVRGQF